jgi:hypothetical protein
MPYCLILDSPNLESQVPVFIFPRNKRPQGTWFANCVFWFQETKSATQVQRKFRTQYLKEPPSRPTITRGTRILLRPDILCVMPCHPLALVFLTLKWNSTGRALFKAHESQRNMHLGKLVFQMSLCGERCEKGLHSKEYKLSIVQRLTDADKVVSKELCMLIFHRRRGDERFLTSQYSVTRALFTSV